jgi:hypothetical protein
LPTIPEAKEAEVLIHRAQDVEFEAEKDDESLYDLSFEE